MATSGGQPGNQNAVKGKLISDAIRKALVQNDAKKLRAGVERLTDAFADGEPWAVKEVLDRMEGKPSQAVDIGGQADNPLKALIEVSFVGNKG